MIRKENWTFGEVSRHSLILVVAGLSFVALGYSFQQYTPGGVRWASLIVARRIMTMESWSYIFIGAGIAVMILAHWPRVGRIWGYTILTGLSACWATCYVVGVWFTAYPGDTISSGFVWSLQAFVWWAISGLPDINHGKGRMPLWIGSRKKS